MHCSRVCVSRCPRAPDTESPDPILDTHHREPSGSRCYFYDSPVYDRGTLYPYGTAAAKLYSDCQGP